MFDFRICWTFCNLSGMKVFLDDYRVGLGERVCAVHYRRMAVQKKLTDGFSSVSVAEVAKTLFSRHGDGNFNLAEPL